MSDQEILDTLRGIVAEIAGIDESAIDGGKPILVYADQPKVAGSV